MLWANQKLRLVLTGKCNIDCVYCHNEGQPKSNTYFPKDLLEKIIDLLSTGSSSLNTITFTGGEPLLHPDLDFFISEFVPFASERAVVTNGLLLTEHRLESLIQSGLTKIRLGVDSLFGKSSKPSSVFSSETPIKEIINMILDRGIQLELNAVVTSYNIDEVSCYVRFCKNLGINAKFFELVKVNSFGMKSQVGDMDAIPVAPFEQFHLAINSAIEGIRVNQYYDYNGANYVYDGPDFSIRYCRYLCPYKLCYTTGTRIDPEGYVYVCMKQRGKYQITSNQTVDAIKATILSAVSEGCP